ncbi:amidohydrolase family protein [Paenibacillus gansuensis]|uniref:Amidohydrolase family protein n=1 Tax=Paenibacillus gansuensis TaxID=306542 RepID=A0ABW5PAW2_9BACL
MTLKIDAHQHYWRISRGDYGWLTPETGVLYNDYMPEDLRKELDKHGFAASIVVQAAPTVEETDFLLSLCEREPTLAGAVGWLDLESSTFAEDLDRLLQSPYLLGIRPMLQDLDDNAYIVRERVLQSARILANRDVVLELLVKTQHLPYVVTLLEQTPGLRAVINHCAKPDIAGRVTEPWLEWMEAAGALPNVYCKLSGLVTEADHRHWTVDQITPYVREVCRIFGPERVMFGSDWPVCLLAASYEEVLHAALDTLPDDWTDQQKANVFGENARRFYKIKLDVAEDDADAIKK